MTYLYTLDELLTMTTNGWSCPDCGRAWVATIAGLYAPVMEGAETCRHPKLIRASLQRG